MNLYRIYRTDEIGYDEYDSAVVAAESEQEARETSPYGDTVCLIWKDDRWFYSSGEEYDFSYFFMG